MNFRHLFLIIFASGLLAALWFFKKLPQDPETPANSILADENLFDLSQPLPKEKVLELFQKLFALPAEDYANWERAAEAGRIPPELTDFRAYLFGSHPELTNGGEKDPTDSLPFIEQADGNRIYPVVRQSLGPLLSTNITQADLNELLPKIAAFQQRLWDYEEQKAAEPAIFQPVRLKPDDLAITLALHQPSENTIEVITSNDPEAPVFHFQMPPFLDGRHVSGARVSKTPFISLHLELSESGSQTLAEVTEKHAGEFFGILLGGEYHAVIGVGGRMETRNLQLPGTMSEETATNWIDSWSIDETASAERSDLID